MPAYGLFDRAEALVASVRAASAVQARDIFRAHGLVGAPAAVSDFPQTMDLSHFLALKPGWDSYDGKTPTEAAVRAAQAVTFVPLSDGGIQVEVHAGGLDVEIEFSPGGQASVTATGVSGVPGETVGVGREAVRPEAP